MPFITTRDATQIHYNDWGAGEPVVLVHGWPLDADMWEYQSGSVDPASHGAAMITTRWQAISGWSSSISICAG